MAITAEALEKTQNIIRDGRDAQFLGTVNFDSVRITPRPGPDDEEYLDVLVVYESRDADLSASCLTPCTSALATTYAPSASIGVLPFRTGVRPKTPSGLTSCKPARSGNRRDQLAGPPREQPLGGGFRLNRFHPKIGQHGVLRDVPRACRQQQRLPGWRPAKWV